MPDIGKDFLGISSAARADYLVQQAQTNQRSGNQHLASTSKPLDNKSIPSKDQQIDKASRQFEALLLHQVFKSMWDTVPKSDFLGGNSNEGEMYRDMFNEALADSFSNGQGIGIRELPSL